MPQITANKADLDLVDKLGETGLTPQEVADAIVKSNEIQSSASEIDAGIDLVDNTDLGQVNIYDYSKFNNGNNLLFPNPYPEQLNSPVHPSVVYKKDYWNGYKYWISFTPYPNSNSAFENPCVIATNDFKNFAEPSLNPLVPKPTGSAYNADSQLFFSYDYSKLYLAFRERWVDNKNKLKIMHTVDGKVWSSPVTILTGVVGVEDFASPSIWWNGASYTIIYHNLDGGDSKKIYRVTSLTNDVYGGYSSPSEVIIPNTPNGTANYTWWHSNFIKLENGQVLGIIQDSINPGASQGDLFLTQSYNDGLNFTMSTNRINTNSNKYRSTLFVKSTYIYILENSTNGNMNLNVLKKGRIENVRNKENERLRCFKNNSDYPSYILAVDSFNRIDSASISSTENGLTWVNGTGFKIENNTLKPNANGNKTYVNTGVYNYSIESRFNTTPTIQQWMIFRLSNTTNYIRIGTTSASDKNSLIIQTIKNGNILNASSILGFYKTGDTIKVDCYDQIIRVFINNTFICEYITDILIGDGVGFQANTGDLTSFDNFIVKG